MFYKQREEKKTHLLNPYDNERYIFFGMVPVSYSLNCFFTILICLLAFTQIFMRMEEGSVAVRLMMLPVYFKFSLMMDTFLNFRWAFVTFFFFAMMQYSATVDVLAWLGFSNIEFYQIKVIKDARE